MFVKKRVISYYASFIYDFFSIIFNFYLLLYYSLDTGRKSNVQKMFWMSSELLMHVHFTSLVQELCWLYAWHGGLFLLCLAWICGVFLVFFAQLRDYLVLKLVVVSGTLSNILDGVKNSSKMNTFSWLFKTLRHIKYPLKIKNYVYFAQSGTQQFENNCFLSRLFFRLKW